MLGFGRFLAVTAAAIGVFVFSAQSRATDFCVPDAGFAACPSGAEVRGDLDSAMNDFSTHSDGQPDTVHVAPGTLTDSGSFETTAGTDALTVVGAGRTETTLTSSSSGNIYVLNTYSGGRKVTFKDLTVLVPESFPNSGGTGSAIQTSDDDFVSVDVVTENVVPSSGSSAFANIVNGGSFTDVRVFGRNGARFSRAFSTFSCGSGLVTVKRASFADSNTGFVTNCPNQPVVIDRAVFSGVNSAFQPSNGGKVSASNVLIESGDQVPVDIYNSMGVGTTEMNLDHATIVATGDASVPALRAVVGNGVSSTSSIELNVSNSLIVGFDSPWTVTAPISGTLGNVDLTVRYSQFNGDGGAGGDVNVTDTEGNISGQPGFVDITDYRLAAGSPAIDSGDPGAANPMIDLDGTMRPIDGNGDDVAVRDMGAFEFNPPPSPPPGCPVNQALCPPKVSKVKFKYRPGKGGALRFRSSKPGSVRAVFKPVPKKLKGKKRKAVKINRKSKKGANKIKLGKKLLKPGRYRLTVQVTDKSGKKSKAGVRQIKVKPRKR